MYSLDDLSADCLYNLLLNSMYLQSINVHPFGVHGLHEFLVAIDVVPDEFIWTVNWLHYLNY